MPSVTIRRRFLCRLLATGTLAVLLVMPAAYAQRPGPPGDGSPAPVRQLSLDEAVAIVLERTGGRVVRADPAQQGDRLVYHIRVLTGEGRVRTYRVDAATGDVR